MGRAVTVLQRERNPDTPQVLWLIGCLVGLGCTLTLIASGDDGAHSENGGRGNQDGAP